MATIIWLKFKADEFQILQLQKNTQTKILIWQRKKREWWRVGILLST